MVEDIPVSITRVEDIPGHILYYIFELLPPKSLANCLCVCAQWRALIFSRDFVSNQLGLEIRRTLHDNDKRCAMLFRWKNHLYFLPLDDDNFIQTLMMKGDNIVDCCFVPQDHGGVKFPLKKEAYLSVVGFSGGLLCLKIQNFSTDEGQLMLWNPLINRCMVLMKIHRGLQRIHATGFGFDPSSKDHKMVVIIDDMEELSYPYYYDQDHNDSSDDSFFKSRDHNDSSNDSFFKSRNTVLLYSLASGCWKKLSLSCKGYINDIRRNPIFTNGAIHWIAQSVNNPYELCQFHPEDDHVCILRFNISEETFDTILLSEDITMKEYSIRGDRVKLTSPFLSLMGIKDTIAVIRGCCMDPNVWVMEEYDKADSWTILYQIDLSPTIHHTQLSFLRDRMGWRRYESCKDGKDCSCCYLETIFGTDYCFMETLVLGNNEREEIVCCYSSVPGCCYSLFSCVGVQAIKGETIEF